MSKDKDILLFRKFIKYYFFIVIIFVLKGLFFPDAFVPEDLQFLVRKYEEEYMDYSPPIAVAGIISALIYLISFLMIYRLNKKWRMIHLISFIVTSICLLEFRFSFLDSIDYTIEILLAMLNGGIIALAFFGSVSKKFK
tara:strand:- start:40 stop:456 length:417 start_codon:yes stop_codon:yes gene_type:complete